MTKLTHIDLADSSFSEANVPIIVEALAKQSELSYLNFRDGGLEEEGIEALAIALTESSPPLVYLDMSGNDASEESLGPMSELLGAVSSTLQEFIMDDSDIMDLDVIKETLLPALSKVRVTSIVCICSIH